MRKRSSCQRALVVAVAILATLAARDVRAQASPGTSGAPPAWGGYIVADPVSQQPVTQVQYGQPGAVYSLPGQVSLPPQPTINPNTGQVWQTYPGQTYPADGAIYPGAPPPGPTYPYLATPGVPTMDPMISAMPGDGGSPSLLPPGTRSGVFQKVNFTATWLPQLNNDSIGWTDLRTDVVFGLPFFTRETPIVITPTYEAHFLDRPAAFDLPPRLHDLSIDFHHFRRVGDHWIADFAVTPGLYADDHSLDTSAAFRVNGRALAVYEANSIWKWVLGVTYLNGGWNKVVPVAGFVYEPSDSVEYELVFPSPRAAWRLPNSPRPGQDEYWFYIAGEFANAIWAFEKSDGTGDLFASRDWRLLFGLERKIVGGLSSRAEIGYVFNRQIKLASGGSDIDLDDTLLFRLGLSY